VSSQDPPDSHFSSWHPPHSLLDTSSPPLRRGSMSPGCCTSCWRAQAGRRLGAGTQPGSAAGEADRASQCWRRCRCWRSWQSWRCGATGAYA